ncbi:MAG: aspartate kinase, partial [Gammaproteobacteria bacterium]|nr:aspartate kinase [Gemmatimonadota bacterium]NIU79197.1 aspartate kinase [Gammaproteobacteria bacterium]
LLRVARSVNETPDPGLVARLLRTGEETSAALLGLAASKAGLRVAVLGADELGILTVGPADDAEPVDVDVERVLDEVRRHEVTVAPGFVGRSAEGR